MDYCIELLINSFLGHSDDEKLLEIMRTLFLRLGMLQEQLPQKLHQIAISIDRFLKSKANFIHFFLRYNQAQ